jgi:two-component system sensor histidine kinase RstB
VIAIASSTPDPREAERRLTEAVGLFARIRPPRAEDLLSPMEREHFLAGEAIVVGIPRQGPTLLVPLGPGRLVELFARPGPPLSPLLLALAVLVLGGAAVVYASLRPLQLQLAALTDGARRLGRGEWAAVQDLPDRGELAEVGAAMREMGSRVQGLVSGREELMRAVSHELRTPVARVGFAVDLLAAQAEPEERERRAQAIQDDLAELEGLIAELLTYTSLEEEQLPQGTEAVDPGPVLERLVAAAAQGPHGRAVALSPGPRPPIRADARLFRRAVDNLLRNAVKFGVGRVTVSPEVEGRHLRLHVDDDGPGVPPDERARIFEPLVRLDPTRSRDTGGIGLGLALARRVCVAHGGRLTCGDSPLGGARFTITWPLA